MSFGLYLSWTIFILAPCDELFGLKVRQVVHTIEIETTVVDEEAGKRGVIHGPAHLHCFLVGELKSHTDRDTYGTARCKECDPLG